MAPPLSLREVCKLLSVSRVTLMRWVNGGKFPRPIRIGYRRLFWQAPVIERLLAGRGG